MITAMGPLWDGNEVWLIAAGGVTFAAFPLLYATMFSSFYSALLLILFALILRGVAIEFRHHVDSSAWRQLWDTCIFIGSVTPAILFGVAFANIFKGIPIDANGVFQGNLYSLLNSYGLLGGVLFLFLFLEHGTLWLSIKTSGDLHERSSKMAGSLWWILLTVALIFLIASKYETKLYDNYYANPILFILILVTLAAFLQIKYFLIKKEYFSAWFSSALAIACCTFFGIIGLFPTVFPSSINSAYSLTAFNSSSSPLTLKIMLVVVIIFVPIIIMYQAWAYNLFKGKVTDQDLASDEAY